MNPSEVLKSITKFVRYCEEGNDLKVLDEAAIILSPNDDGFFHDLDKSTNAVLEEIEISNHVIRRTATDDHGTKWIILTESDFMLLVNLIDKFSMRISELNLGPRMIAAVFKGEFKGTKSYWICNYRTSRYYPFVPTGSNQRDYESEMAIAEMFRINGIPVESPQNWYPLWNAPL